MVKQTKPSEESRQAGPKFARNVIPASFQIRRPASPMADLLNEAVEGRGETDIHERAEVLLNQPTPVISTPVKSTGVISTPVKSTAHTGSVDVKPLPELDAFLDVILPRFPPARQAILLRLYRWSEATERDIVVSTPRLAAKTNMDEKSCRAHLQALFAEGYIIRRMDGDYHAKFGGSDRAARGLILHLSANALADLKD
ncbi:MAG: hypothetical protein H0T92_19110 [Pyrinomonadaceae bacterium]|nr:hypothetical protein [Pyrinomonadaceae bacterium]